MSTVIPYSYSYLAPSSISRKEKQCTLNLATFSNENSFPYFFRGQLTKPKRSAQQMLLVSRIAKSRFYTPPAMVAKQIALADPVVTSGGGKLRFESFSQCCGVYCRLDLLENAIQGSFAEQGTTNVDFNREMCNALGNIQDEEVTFLSVGSDYFELETPQENVIERQVDLPLRWYKGFVEVQAYASTMSVQLEVNGPVARRFLQSLPRQTPAKSECYLFQSRTGIKSSRRPVSGGVLVGGVERLVHLAPLAQNIEKMRIYSAAADHVAGVELIFPESRIFLAISPYASRGFSGEGQVLSYLLEEVEETDISSLQQTIKNAGQISPEQLALNTYIAPNKITTVLAILGSRGLVGFDQYEEVWFYRELPFRYSDMSKLHPRLEGARKLVSKGAVKVIEEKSGVIIKADVSSSDAQYHVCIVDGKYKCTCPWSVKNQGKQGSCKHILSVQMFK